MGWGWTNLDRAVPKGWAGAGAGVHMIPLSVLKAPFLAKIQDAECQTDVQD